MSARQRTLAVSDAISEAVSGSVSGSVSAWDRKRKRERERERERGEREREKAGERSLGERVLLVQEALERWQQDVLVILKQF